MKILGKMVIRRYLHAHTQAAIVHLSTRGTPFVISVQSMVEFTAAISWLHSSAA